ncbi:unnamed protein product [Acanthosepion pharaonis]|uniref:Uncharacterized protein n=1 Tax=Acanthosepion pharaonis TaxID=158019 RepID=A0A812DT89_ACAPH|nr:unnamed protein product [Sepia pharaonis]
MFHFFLSTDMFREHSSIFHSFTRILKAVHVNNIHIYTCLLKHIRLSFLIEKEICLSLYFCKENILSLFPIEKPMCLSKLVKTDVSLFTRVMKHRYLSFLIEKYVSLYNSVNILSLFPIEKPMCLSKLVKTDVSLFTRVRKHRYLSFLMEKEVCLSLYFCKENSLSLFPIEKSMLSLYTRLRKHRYLSFLTEKEICLSLYFCKENSTSLFPIERPMCLSTLVLTYMSLFPIVEGGRFISVFPYRNRCVSPSDCREKPICLFFSIYVSIHVYASSPIVKQICISFHLSKGTCLSMPSVRKTDMSPSLVILYLCLHIEKHICLSLCLSLLLFTETSLSLFSHRETDIYFIFAIEKPKNIYVSLSDCKETLSLSSDRKTDMPLSLSSCVRRHLYISFPVEIPICLSF